MGRRANPEYIERIATVTGPELKARAAEIKVNPYFLAYALSTGATSCKEAFDRDRGGHLFINWNEGLWWQQAKAEGIDRIWVSIQKGAVDRHIAICAEHVPTTIAEQIEFKFAAAS